MPAMPHAHGQRLGQNLLPELRLETRGSGRANAIFPAASAGAGRAVRRAAYRLHFPWTRRSIRSWGARVARDCPGNSCGAGRNGENSIRCVWKRLTEATTVESKPSAEYNEMRSL